MNMARIVFVFVHVISAIGVFAALAVEGAMLLQIRRSVDSAQRRAALAGFRLVPRVAIPSLLVTLLSGMYLTTTVWGWRTAWIEVAFPSLLVTAFIGATTTGPRIARLQTTLSGDSRRDPLLSASVLMRGSILIGIVFLMTVKPPLEASLIAMATAAGSGLLAALTCFGRRTAHGSMVSA
jgi:uncharacterized membrane protein YbjE (DUF340 family)